MVEHLKSLHTSPPAPQPVPLRPSAIDMYDRHGAHCFAFALSFVGNRYDAEAIVETVFTDRVTDPQFALRSARLGEANAVLVETHREYCDHFAPAR